jgi:hypothetical protein
MDPHSLLSACAILSGWIAVGAEQKNAETDERSPGT